MNKTPEFFNQTNDNFRNNKEQPAGQTFSYYLSILWKWKFLITVIVFLFATVSIVISLVLPQTFQSDSLVQLGKFKDQEIESFIDVRAIMYTNESLQEIINTLDYNYYIDTAAMANLFDINPYQTLKKDAVSQYIQIAGRGNSPQEAVNVVTAVNEYLVRRHAEIFKEAENAFLLEIEAIKRDQEKTVNEIAQKQSEIERINKDIQYYQNEVNIRATAESEGQGRIVESYINLIAGLKNNLDAKYAYLENLNKELKNYDILFQRKEFEKAYHTKNTSIVTSPNSPDTRISPNRKDIVVSTTVIGFLISLFICFIYEFISLNKQYFINKKKKGKDKQNNQLQEVKTQVQAQNDPPEIPYT